MPSHAVITLACVLYRPAEQMWYTVLSPYVWIMIYKQPMWGASVEEIKVKHLRGWAERSTTVSTGEVKGLGVRQIAKVKVCLVFWISVHKDSMSSNTGILSLFYSSFVPKFIKNTHFLGKSQSSIYLSISPCFSESTKLKTSTRSVCMMYITCNKVACFIPRV